MIRHATCLVLAGFLLGSTLSSEAALAAFEPSVFGSQERARTIRGPHPFRNWARVLEHHVQDLEHLDDCPSPDTACTLQGWLKQLRELRDQPLDKQLEVINETLNTSDYLTDLRNWGIEDFWATPLEFLIRSGDCEDYSIAKFMSLRYLGLANDRMRIVVVNDENLGVGHAVLVVFEGDRAYILDNQTNQVVEESRIRHYAPLYSVNETGWWLHTR